MNNARCLLTSQLPGYRSRTGKCQVTRGAVVECACSIQFAGAVTCTDRGVRSCSDRLVGESACSPSGVGAAARAAVSVSSAGRPKTRGRQAWPLVRVDAGARGPQARARAASRPGGALRGELHVVEHALREQSAHKQLVRQRLAFAVTSARAQRVEARHLVYRHLRVADAHL